MSTAFRFPAPLYPIAVPSTTEGRSPLDLAEAILAAGVRLLQLRLKNAPTRALVETARAVRAAADSHGAQLIINDRADVARLVDAAGVHLGQDDLPANAARRLLGPGKIIGLSTHSLAQARAALRTGGLDYLAFGPIFSTRSKEDPDPVQGVHGLGEVRHICPLPLVAIGGISSANVAEVLQAGADAVAVIGAIAHADDPRAATRDLLQSAEAATARRSRPRN